jgi:hypothetical protein
VHREAGLKRGPNELVAGVGDERRAGVAHERDRPVLGEQRQYFRPRPRRIVVVIGFQWRGNVVALEEPPGDTRVLAVKGVGGAERFERPERHVGEIADGGGDEMEAGRERRGDVDMRADAEPSRRLGGECGVFTLPAHGRIL